MSTPIMKFKVGDRVYLAKEYWVRYLDDCKTDHNAQRIPLGSEGVITNVSAEGPDIVRLDWDNQVVPRGLVANVDCLELVSDPPSEEELDETLKSIVQSWKEV
jgi:hypothetical protein